MENFSHEIVVKSLLIPQREEEIIENLKRLKAYEDGVFKTTDSIVIIKADQYLNSRIPQEAVRINGEYILAVRNVDCKRLSIVNEVRGVLKGSRLIPLHLACLEACGGIAGRYSPWSISIVRSDDGWLVCLSDGSNWIEGLVYSADPQEVERRLNVKSDLAMYIARILGYRSLKCLDEVVGGECVSEVGVVINANNAEVYIMRLKGRNWHRVFIAELPADIRLIYDRFFRQDYYTAFESGRLIAADTSLDSFIGQLKNAGFVIEKASAEVQLAVKALARRTVGYITPGITEEGIIDPSGVLDLNDYGIEALVNAYNWIVKYYPEANRYRALANIAFTLAKIISPIIRRGRSVFIDYIIWNYGRTGEGKTSLASNILHPILGKAEDTLIRGPVETEPRLRNLISLNRLPLILDEQDDRSLTANAPLFLSSTIGLGTISIHASRYGLGIGARFINMRGIIIFTNVPFQQFLAKARSIASDAALARRVIVVDWANEPAAEGVLEDIPDVRPMLGTVNNIFKRYKSEFLNTKDLVGLALLLLDKLKDYAKSDVEKAILGEYSRAVEEAFKEAREARSLGVASDEDLLVEASYDYARKLGVQARSWIDVVMAIFNNPASRVELLPGSDSDAEDVKRGLLQVLSTIPPELASLLDERRVKVRIWVGGLGGRIPNAREFLGKPRAHYPGRGHYYILGLDEFLKPFIVRG